MSGLRIGVIGAGFSGIGAAILLRKQGFAHVTIIERSSEIGGTWRDNTYPGCACDIRSHLYSYSFFPNPNWSCAYPRQPEIQRYLLDCVDHFGVRSLIRFDTEIAQTRFDERRSVWVVTTTSGEHLEFDVIVNGTGPLSRPSIPEIPGLSDFKGRVFHSAQWDHGHALEGERVASIGTGASAIQYVPEVAPKVDQLYVFQRTAPWVVPRDDRPFTAVEQRRFARFPALAKAHRYRIYLQNEMRGHAFRGGRRISDFVTKMATKYIESEVVDPGLRAAVTPDYAPGCKRLLVSNDWYSTIQRDNVELVTDGIDRVVADGIVTSDGTHRSVDTIVLGTGFHATEFLAPMKVFGRGGLELSDLWQQGAATHLGVLMHGFPNLFLLVGPSTALGHNSIVFMIEAQMHYIMSALQHVRARGKTSVEVRASVQRRSYERVQRKLRGTVWTSGCASWYQSAGGRNDTIWPSNTIDYWLRTRRFRARQAIVR